MDIFNKEKIKELERQIRELERQRQESYLRMTLDMQIDNQNRLNNVIVELAKLRFSK